MREQEVQEEVQFGLESILEWNWQKRGRKIFRSATTRRWKKGRARS
jgi:hypothetical protein